MNNPKDLETQIFEDILVGEFSRKQCVKKKEEQHVHKFRELKC